MATQGVTLVSNGRVAHTARHVPAVVFVGHAGQLSQPSQPAARQLTSVDRAAKANAKGLHGNTILQLVKKAFSQGDTVRPMQSLTLALFNTQKHTQSMV